MNYTKLSLEEYLSAFNELETLYPRVLPLTMWRAWELAIYRRFQLTPPLLDLGCGDGRFLKQVWSSFGGDVIGIDINPHIISLAEQSGVYTQAHLAPAHNIPESNETFETVFSNCAMEHMDQIDKVVAEVERVLKPGGRFLFSVVTDNLLKWAPLPQLLNALGLIEETKKLSENYIEYHHLVNPLSITQWMDLLRGHGFEVLEYFPIAPNTFAQVFTALDQLWHVPYHTSEIGEPVLEYFQELPNFSEGIKDIITGLWKLSTDNGQGAGAVFYLKKGTYNG